MGPGACVCRNAHVEVREQLLWVSFLLTPHGCWESELGYQAWESNLVFCKQIEFSFTHPQLLYRRWTVLIQCLQYNHRYHTLTIGNLRTWLPLESWTCSLHPSPPPGIHASTFCLHRHFSLGMLHKPCIEHVSRDSSLITTSLGIPITACVSALFLFPGE